MTAKNDLHRSVVDRPLALRVRGDIQQVQTTFAGQGAYVLKDPVTLELFHLTAQEHFLFESLRRPESLARLQQKFQSRFAPQRITVEALQQGIDQLYRQGLLLSEYPGQGEQLLQRGLKRSRNQRLQSLMNLLCIRLGSIDATGWIDRIYDKLRWLFSPAMLVFVLCLIGYAAWIVLGHGREVVLRLPSLAELVQPKYWFMWLATIALVKVVHELAHGLTCKHFGGRCHEMGLLLLALLPCLYCDVSDIWRLPNKWQRIAVSAAGMVVEIVIAAVATILWWHTQPGLFNTWCLSLMITCSIGTLLVNANPLLRYDGYYILSDLVEVPNLTSRARGLLPRYLKQWLRGASLPDDPMVSPRMRRGIAIYAVASQAYLVVVLLGIFAMLLAFARPRHLENLVYTLACLTLLGLMVPPLTRAWKFLSDPMTRSRLRRGRVTLLAVGVGGFVAAVLFFPIPNSVNGPMVLVPSDSRVVYAKVGGELLEALPHGTEVQPGQVVARLADPDVALALEEHQGDFESRRARHQQMLILRTVDHEIAEQLPTARAALADAKAQLEELRKEADRLELTSPVSGTVMAVPDKLWEADGSGRLPVWSGSLLDSQNRGCWVEPGSVLCVVANPQLLEVLVAVDQGDAPDVLPGQSVRVRVDSGPTRYLAGEVVEVSRRTTDPANQTDSSAARNGENLPSFGATARFHWVQVRLEQHDPLLWVGARGRAKIETEGTTLSDLLTTQFKRFLRLPW